MTERVLRASGGQVVYAELKRQILTLELAPGTRLYEPELARQLQVSRTPLREAIKLLLAEDLLEQLPTGGVVVPLLSARDIEELYTVRAALEGIQAGDAARKATAADLGDLADIVERNALLVGFADDAMSHRSQPARPHRRDRRQHLGDPPARPGRRSPVALP